MRTIEDLKMRQALPLDIKIRLTKSRIREWINEFGTDGVYVSFSGGKDSTALLNLVREDYPDVPAVCSADMAVISKKKAKDASKE